MGISQNEEFAKKEIIYSESLKGDDKSAFTEIEFNLVFIIMRTYGMDNATSQLTSVTNSFSRAPIHFNGLC